MNPSVNDRELESIVQKLEAIKVKQVDLSDQYYELGRRAAEAYANLALDTNSPLPEAEAHLEKAFEFAKQATKTTDARNIVAFSQISGLTRLYGKGKPTGYLFLAYRAAEEAPSEDDFREAERLLLESLRVMLVWQFPIWKDPWQAGALKMKEEYEGLIEIAEKNGNKKATSRLRKQLRNLTLLVWRVMWKENRQEAFELFQKVVDSFDFSRDHRSLAIVRRALAQLYLEDGNFDKALYTYRHMGYHNASDDYHILRCQLEILVNKMRPKE